MAEEIGAVAGAADVVAAGVALSDDATEEELVEGLPGCKRLTPPPLC
jgi:hypothetical protein